MKSASNSQWTVNETYDRFGNLNAQSPPPNFSLAADAATNRVIGSPYDLAGNLLNDGANTLVYDGEDRIATSTNNGVTSAYSYDGSGFRVKKNVGTGTATVYIFSGTKVIAEYVSGAAPSSPSNEYVYSGSQLLATIAGSTTTYHHPDHLSVRLDTDAGGAVSGQQGHYPLGESWYDTGSSTTKFKFTSYQRDAESGNDYAMARNYVNRYARFSSPDPIGGGIADPQSLNRYAYTRNDPINLIDPSGLHWLLPDCNFYEGENIIICYFPWLFLSHAFFPTLDDGGGGGGGQEKKKYCFAELKFNSNPAKHGAPDGATHSFWYVQNSSGNQYIVSAGPTRSGAGGDYGALNVYGPNKPVTDSTKDSGESKASDLTHWSTGRSPDNCDAVAKLLAAANAFPNNSIPYNPLGPNSNSVAKILGDAAGFTPTAPPGAVGWGVPIHP